MCADAHSFPLLEESNITEAEVIKALPYLEGKPKGDRSMERKRSAGGTLSQEAVQARPYRVSPALLQTSGDSLQVNNQRVMVLVPLLEIRVISRSSCRMLLSRRLEMIELTAEQRTYVRTRGMRELRDRLPVARRRATEPP